MKMPKVNKKIFGVSLALVLTLAIALSATVSVFAAAASSWPTYQGDANHLGRITNGTPYTGSSPTVTSLLPDSGRGSFSGVDTQPVMYTDSNGTTWAFVITDSGTYSGSTTPVNGIYPGTGGARLAVVNCNTKARTSYALSRSGGFQLSSPYLDTSSGSPVLYVAVTDYFSLLSDDDFLTETVWETADSASIDTTAPGYAVFANSAGSVSQTVTIGNISNLQLISQLILTSGTSATYQFTATKTGGSPVVLDSGTINSANSPVYIEKLVSSYFTATGTGEYTITLTVTPAAGATVKADYVRLNQQSVASIKKVTNPTSSANITAVSVGGATFGGQINTPLTKYGNYLYYGTYNGQNKYYQLNPSNGDTNIFTGANGFYWAGAWADENYVYFGGDGGYLYYVPVNNFETTSVTSGTNQNTVTLSGAGNVRSTITQHDGSLYFTSQSSILWKMTKASVSTAPAVAASVTIQSGSSSTSTPAISENGIIYVGYYVSFSTGGVKAYNTSLSLLGDVYTGDPVQCSPIVYTDGVWDYVYFTTNSGNGGGYCNRFNGTTAQSRWSAPGTSTNRYALQGFASDNGYLIYGDDANYLYVVDKP